MRKDSDEGEAHAYFDFTPSSAVCDISRQTQCRLFVRRLAIEANIGVYEWEKAAAQPVLLDLELTPASLRACQTDRLADALDYTEVIGRLRALAVDHHYNLIEALAEAMASLLQKEFEVPWLRITLAKLSPFPGAEVGVLLERGEREYS